MATTTFELPQNLGDIMGAYDSAHWETIVAELKPDVGVLERGTVLTLITGKLEKVGAATEATAYGVLLDPHIDTSVKNTDGSVTASVARAGSFRGPALLVGVGTNAATLADRLRDVGIYVEGPITVPAAGTFAKAKAETEEEPEHDRERRRGR